MKILRSLVVHTAPDPVKRPLLSRLVVIAALMLVAAAFAPSAHAQSTPDLYVSDVVSGEILKIAPDGTQTTFSSLGDPRGLAFDQASNLYVADNAIGSIIKITPAGVQSTFASGISTPRGIAFDSAGNLYVASNSGNTILKFTPAGMQSTFAGGLNTPADLAFDRAGNLYESDRGSGSILKFTPSGSQSTFATGLNLAAGLAFDSQGNLYEADQGTVSVLRFAPDGSRSTFVSLNSTEADNIYRLAIDAADNIYLSASLGSTGGFIYHYTPAGVRSTFATESDRVGFIAFGQTGTPTPTPTPRPATLGNISTRLQVGTGANVMIAGFIVQGSVPKRVLIRAAGPSLTQFGVPNALANPQLELHDTSSTIGMNDDWQTTQIGGVITADQVADIQNSGLAPRDPLESAIIATLAPGSYTAIVQGANSGTGVGIVEAYDLDLTSGSFLANIATRGFVQTADNAMIGGFIVVTQPTRVIIRAIGPSLSQFGVPDALANPQLELHDATSIIGQNDDWQATQLGGIITSDQVAEIQKSQLAPTNALESAIIATLAPGSYTAIVRGVNDTTGNALVEVYSLP